MINAFGHIKIDRKILKWEWYSDSKMVHLFIHLLLSANHKDTKYQGVEIKRGQLIVGRLKLAATVGFSENQIRACLKRLKKTGEITIKTTNKFSIVTICKYDTYQSYKENNNQQEYQPTTNESTNKPPTTHQQLTTNNNAFNNDNNEKKTNTAEAEDNFSLKKIISPDSFPNWRQECVKFFKNIDYKKKMSKHESISVGVVEKAMIDFLLEQDLKGQFKNESGLINHFGHWYKKHKSNANGNSLSKGFVEVPEYQNYDDMETW